MAYSAPFRPRKPRSLFFRVYSVCAFLSLPGIVIAIAWMWKSGVGAVTLATVFLLFSLYALLLSMSLSESITHRLRTLSNVTSALREEDYSFRARGTQSGDALGELSTEINALADTLQQQRTQTIEATALLSKIVEVMDAPLFAFDRESRLRLINTAGKRLIGRNTQKLDTSAEELGIAPFLNLRDESIVTLASSPAKWMLRRTAFRQGGVPHSLLVLSDVSIPLQEEERLAWQRLIRVLGHELSNSLAPIKSIAESLASRMDSLCLDDEQNRDFRRGLEIIKSRADAIHRFVQAYRALAQLPAPARTEVALRPLLERIVELETRLPVRLQSGPDVTLFADADQLEQMLINLLRNAVEASLDNGSNDVEVSWCRDGTSVSIYIDDHGKGIANLENLFVPFYTTKPEGSGVGLVLARQIAHAHSGTLHLETNPCGIGTRAEVTLATPSCSGVPAHENGRGKEFTPGI